MVALAADENFNMISSAAYCAASPIWTWFAFRMQVSRALMIARFWNGPHGRDEAYVHRTRAGVN
jgi:hypothetical protein